MGILFGNHPKKRIMFGGGGGGFGAIGNAVSSAGGFVSNAVKGLVSGAANAMTPDARLANDEQINAAIDAITKQRDSLNAQLASNQGYLTSAQGSEQNALSILQGAATGNAPSQAQGILQQGLDQSIASQYALAQSGNLSQQVAGQKEAQNNIAQLQQQTANQAGMLRAQEMATNRQAYAAATGQNLNMDQSFINALNSQVNQTTAQQEAAAAAKYGSDTSANAASNQALQKNAQTLTSGLSSAAGFGGSGGGGGSSLAGGGTMAENPELAGLMA